MKYLVLLRGINVGGKNKVKMAELKACLEELGFEKVATYIQSGNILLESKQSAELITTKIEQALPQKFKLDSKIIKAFVYSKNQFEKMVKNRPKDFGEAVDKYYYDFIFLKNISSQEAIKEFEPHPEVDAVWAGPGVIYHRRLTTQRTKSRMSKITSKAAYKNMTIRSFTTTSRLFDLINT